MTKREELLALAERCEAASGADRKLDRNIAKSQGWHRVEPRFARNKSGGWISREDFIGTMSDGRPILDSLHGTTIHRDVPAYTASLDAAMSLVPEGWSIGLGDLRGYEPIIWRAHLRDHNNPDAAKRRWLEGHNGQPALALTAAALRAHAEKTGTLA